MTTLSQALEDYLNLRRGLGFKLEEDARILAEFVSFLECFPTNSNSSHITQCGHYCHCVYMSS